MRLRFPDDFVWAAAVAAGAVEGMRRDDGRTDSVWDRFWRHHGVAGPLDAETAADHLRRFKDDIEDAAGLGLDALRFSLSWSRILPAGRGAPNTAGLDTYDHYVDVLLDAGITPIPTLYHWDLPQALQDDGGWVNRRTAFDLGELARVAAERLGDRVSTWFTIEQPAVVAHRGHRLGDHAPEVRDDTAARTAAHHLLLGHALAAQELRQAVRDARVGIVAASSVDHASPGGDAWFLDLLGGRGHLGGDTPAVEVVLPGDLDRIAEPIDVLGVAHGYPAAPPHGQGVQPSLFELLGAIDARALAPALFVTIALSPLAGPGRHDGERIASLRESLAQVHLAMRRGIPVEGVAVWSLLDGIDFAEGAGTHRGLFDVDPLTLHRTRRDSAAWFAQVAADGTVVIDDPAGGAGPG